MKKLQNKIASEDTNVVATNVTLILVFISSAFILGLISSHNLI